MTDTGLATALDALKARRVSAARPRRRGRGRTRPRRRDPAGCCAPSVDHADGVYVAPDTAGAIIGKFDSMRTALRSFGGGPR